MDVVVIGTGAVGGYFGSRLGEAGHDVAFLARGKHLEAMRRDGLYVESPKGNVHLQALNASDRIEDLPAAQLILLGIKAWQVEEMLPRLKPLILPETMVLPLQNGVETPHQIADILGEQHALGGLCRIIAEVSGPGRILHHSFEPTITFGELNGEMSERVKQLKEQFQVAGLKAETPEDIQLAIWKKFLFISAVSGLGAITRATIGEFRSDSETRTILLTLLREIVSVGKAHGVNFTNEDPAKMLSFIDSLEFETTASMQRDIMAGRPSELEAQTGAVVRLAKKANVEIPQNAFIYSVLTLAEKRARGIT